MTGKFSTMVGHRRGTRVLLAIFGALVLAVLIAGPISILGIILSYLATLVLAFVITRPWRKIKWFLILFVVSFIGIFFLSFLHQVVVLPLAVAIGGIDALQSPVFKVFDVTFSILIAFVCPVGLLFGVAGSVWLFLTRGGAPHKT